MPHTLTTCTFCGVGCGIYLESAGNSLTGAYPSMTHPTNRGRICVRGWHVNEVASAPDRLLHLLDGERPAVGRQPFAEDHRVVLHPPVRVHGHLPLSLLLSAADPVLHAVEGDAPRLETRRDHPTRLERLLIEERLGIGHMQLSIVSPSRGAAIAELLRVARGILA